MNAYEILGLSQRLTIAADEIHTAFRLAGKSLHPDAGGDGAAFEQLRHARNILLSPSMRLEHWLALQGQTLDYRGTIDPALMDLFTTIGHVLQQAETMARRRRTTATALGLAMLEDDTLILRDCIEDQIACVDRAISEQTSNFPKWDQALPEIAISAPAIRNLRFLEKWKASLRSAYASLS